MTLTAEEWARIMANMNHAKAHMLLILKLKLDFAKRLPFLLCVLAHHDESVARSGASRILDSWNDSPRQETQHRVTWRWLSDDVVVAALRAFADGRVSRVDLPGSLLLEIAKLRFISIVETTIEAKHAQLSMQLKKHGVGPVRSSLANRQRLIEHLCKDKAGMQSLVEAFSVCRHYRRLPNIFGFHRHPELSGVGRSIHKLVPAITKVLYRCDLTSKFLSQRAAHKEHKRAEDRDARIAAQIMQQKQRLTYDDIRMYAIREHFRQVCLPEMVYSLPVASLDMVSISCFLGSSEAREAKRRRLLDTGVDCDLEMDVEVGADISTKAQHVFFKPILLTPADKRFLKVAPGLQGGGVMSEGVCLFYLRLTPKTWYNLSAGVPTEM